MFSPVKPDIDLPQLEEKILEWWDKEKIFQKSIDQRSDAPLFRFYDGPPFATGLPHYGHLLAGILKDIVPRYATMCGYQVPRRFGWDCHGLPVEHEINKAHGLVSRKQILAMGIGPYNEACRSIVKRYTQEWKSTVRRIGRWVDMENGYYTMDASFMESVWWVFRELWDKGMIYEGHKVVPYSTGLSTPLSNFEANLNYKTVQDPAIYVLFPSRSQEYSFCAWTTTPWTIPSNLALALSKDAQYVKVRVHEHTLIIAESRLEALGLPIESCEPIATEELLGQEYKPPFAAYRDQPAFRVVLSDHVTLDAGTGIVHIAPAFGEEDYDVCKKNNLPFVHPLDEDGIFGPAVPELEGLGAKEADRTVIQYLKGKNLLLKQETIEHSYPFCWRTDTPLIYSAVASWFVRVESIKKALCAANLETSWVPEHIRDGRFGNWLENARDWAISRNRFWGTPLPIWRNENEVRCIGSIQELAQAAGIDPHTITDLHMHSIDQITIPSNCGGAPLKRIDGVLDCWFESGAMPFASVHYPFSGLKLEECFPADFIAEGLDQTRGWFYTLNVLGVALFNKAPFKNVIVNGLILAEDGKKMSKSLRNYPDPHVLLNTFGADALRLYLIHSTAVKAQELRFSENGVREVARKILIRWWNANCFFINYAHTDGIAITDQSTPFGLDRWILSRLHRLIHETRTHMAAYKLYLVVPQLLQFIEELTNTYIRFHRRQFWQEGMTPEKQAAFGTLHTVLVTFARLMAPFTPFLAEESYQLLTPGAFKRHESVHLDTMPEANQSLINDTIEATVAIMERIMLLGRTFRESIATRSKVPLKSIVIIHRNKEALAGLQAFENAMREELNIRAFSYDTDESRYMSIAIEPRFAVLGPKAGKNMKLLANAIRTLPQESIIALENGASITLFDIPISMDDVAIQRAAKSPNICVLGDVAVLIDPTVEHEQEIEGLAREIIRKVQAARKSADCLLSDRITLTLFVSPASKAFEALSTHSAWIARETLAKECLLKRPSSGHLEEAELEDGSVCLIGITH